MKITITDNIWEYSVEDYMVEFGITHTDLTNIKSFAPVAQANLDEVISEFYNQLRHYENFTGFFPNEDKIAEVSGMQREYWLAFFEGEIINLFWTDK